MDILVILERNPFATSNAANNRFLSLAEGLVENGCIIELLIIGGYSSKNEKTVFKNSGLINGVSYKYLITYNFRNYTINRAIGLLFPNNFFVSHIQNQIRIKHYDYLWLGVSSRIVRIGLKLFKKSVSCKYFHERSEYSWISIPNRKLHNAYLEKFLPQLDILAVMTFILASYYEKHLGQTTKMLHLPMTVDFARFNIDTSDFHLDKPYIGYCGTMNNHKDGVDILIQAFIKIMGQFPDLNLFLAGPLLPKSDYELQLQIISKYKAENRIKYVGNISRKDMPLFLLKAKLLAFARPTSKQSEGGFPTKLGEYLASGNPVCITNVGEIGHYLEDNKSAFISDPDSIDSFSNGLRRALTSKNASKIGEAGRNVALRFFNKDIQAKLLYNFLIKNK